MLTESVPGGLLRHWAMERLMGEAIAVAKQEG
jgi:hypothetical protein